jgi:Ca-activated chloride channel family protein
MSQAFESLTGLTFLDPSMLLLGLLVLIGMAARSWRGVPAIRFAPGTFLRRGADPTSTVDSSDGSRLTHRGLPSSWRVRLLPVPRFLQVVGLLLVVVALARPVYREQLPPEIEGIDILLCLDTSSSMTAADMDRSRTRLDVAKDAAAQFISGRPDDRIGLICFARYPDVRCPLTLDHRALKNILSEVDTVESEGPEDATGIGTAVGRSAQVLRGSTSTSKVVILLTDGEENVASAGMPEEIAPIHAAQLCEALGVRVYTIAAGVGSPDPTGKWVEPDTRQVERLAERTGGRFFRARDAGSVGAVYAYIDALETVEHDEPRFRIEERFLPFLAAAILLLVASRLLQSTWLEALP